MRNPSPWFSLLLVLLASSLWAQKHNTNQNKFRQLHQELPSPNAYRTGGGAPGQDYFQQKVDYRIDVTLVDSTQQLFGEVEIHYHNNSPHPLEYLWVQLDQNVRQQNSLGDQVESLQLEERMYFRKLKDLHNNFDGGFKLEWVRDGRDRPLPHTVVNTMMRVDPPQPLAPGDDFVLKIKYYYNINNRKEIGGRSGYEYFPEDDNYLYTIAQFYPRMCVYDDHNGWQNKQFLGRGEFALEFGDFQVRITVPDDHVVGATGELKNTGEVLSPEQRDRLDRARSSTEDPVLIVTEDEARQNEQEQSSTYQTWEFHAEQVRDFAFATSRKFIWDAMAVPQQDGTTPMAMSLYPKEGNPLWEKYSTRIVAHTLRTYSKYTFPYPYPVAYSVHAWRIGMEYPMICFNWGRPEQDGTYTERTKYSTLGVIIHEVGHNYFPMIVSSDERQWTWMDEGLNSFLQYLTEQEWERDYPSRRGPAWKIVDYMKGDPEGMTPIMTNSESIYQFGNNAYGKPATALNILRETILGRELFDHAFKIYANRWMFKHPEPADLFRTLEDASGVDLDWFWRGWFYTTDPVDLGVTDVTWFKVDTRDPRIERPRQMAERRAQPEYISDLRNRNEFRTIVEQDSSLADFYTLYDPLEYDLLDVQEYLSYMATLDDDDSLLLDTAWNYYQVDFENVGGLVMPLIVELHFADGSRKIHRIPAEIWRKNHENVSKVFYTKKELVQVVLDPHLETADIDRANNYWPPRYQPTRFQLFKRRQRQSENPMQRARRVREMEKEMNGETEIEETRDREPQPDNTPEPDND